MFLALIGMVKDLPGKGDCLFAVAVFPMIVLWLVRAGIVLVHVASREWDIVSASCFFSVVVQM